MATLPVTDNVSIVAFSFVTILPASPDTNTSNSQVENYYAFRHYYDNKNEMTYSKWLLVQQHLKFHLHSS